MKFIIVFVLVMLLSFAAGLFFPWWIIALTSFVVALFIPLKPFLSFVAAFVALFILWGAQALYMDMLNEHVLSTRMAGVLGIGSSYIALVLVTAFVGALVAGMGALTGSLLRRSFARNNAVSAA